MPLSLLVRYTIPAICVALNACGDSSNRQFDHSGTDAAGQPLLLGQGANMVPVIPDSPDTSTDPLQPEITPGGSKTPTVSETEHQFQDPTNEITVGAPGLTVSCGNRLPCRWVSEDLQFSLTITNADNIAARSRLSIQYSIRTLHDSNIFVTRAGDAVDGDGVTFKPTDQVLGEGNGGAPQRVAAGLSLEGTLNFNTGTSGKSLAQWSVALVDGGMLRTPVFNEIPVGTITTEQADCQYTLPCIWTTPGRDVAITLRAVGGLSSGSRLTADFTVETSTDVMIAVDAGSVASGSDGTLFESRSHSIGDKTDYRRITALAAGRAPVNASVDFYRTVNVPAGLDVLSLVTFKDQPVPRWNPRFINVPVD